MNRQKFLDVFQENSDGSLSPRVRINVNGVEFGPGVTFGQGVVFGGINFHQFKYLDIATEDQDGVKVIKGFYKQ